MVIGFHIFQLSFISPCRSQQGTEGGNWSQGDEAVEGNAEHGQVEDTGRVSWSNADSVTSSSKGGQQSSLKASSSAQPTAESEEKRDTPVNASRVSDKDTSPEVSEESADQGGGTSGTSFGMAWDWSDEPPARDWSAEPTTKDWSASPPPPIEWEGDRNEEQDTEAVADEDQNEESAEDDALMQELIRKNNYNPAKFEIETEGARYFVIKSYSEDDIHRSIKYSIWCSTERGNKKLDQAFRDQQTRNGVQRPIYLFYSVNGSGYFCGMAEMTSAVDYNVLTGVWAQDKWRGTV